MSFPAGIYAEGGYFFPKSVIPYQSIDNKFATGGGVFIEIKPQTKFSIGLRAGFRYASSKAISYITPGNTPSDDGYNYNRPEPIDLNCKQNYFVLPVKISYLFTKSIFAETGIETSWLLNYNYVKKKPEYSWRIGAGYKFSSKMSVSINYIRGFKEQEFGPIRYNGELYIQKQQNQTPMFSLSYALFDFKK